MAKDADVLQMVRDALEDGDSLVEVAENFVNDEDVVQFHPRLTDILLRLDAVAQELVDYVNLD